DSSTARDRHQVTYRFLATVNSHGPSRVSGWRRSAWATRRSHVSSSRSSAFVRLRVRRARKVKSRTLKWSYTTSKAVESPALRRRTRPNSTSRSMTEITTHERRWRDSCHATVAGAFLCIGHHGG